MRKLPEPFLHSKRHHKVYRVMIMGKRYYGIYLVAIALSLVLIFGTDRVAETMSQSRQVPRDRCIVLDAGHGGVDGGAVSCTGHSESDINLEIALRLEALFELMGYDTRMIRSEDISIHTKGDTIAQKKVSDLKERVRIVNETPGGILISIHQNTFRDSRYSGAQVFYAQTEGSQEMAEHVQQRLGYALDPTNDRKCKPSNGVYLMDNIKCTGILIECGFLSNLKEEAMLRDAQYQKKLSVSIVTAVCCLLNGA